MHIDNPLHLEQNVFATVLHPETPDSPLRHKEKIMSQISIRSALATSIILLAGAIALPLRAQTAITLTAPPDETLYTSYFFGTAYQSATWIVCGSTAQTEGCFGSGSLGPFGQIGALLEGNQTVSGNTVTRHIYVVDVASGSSADSVVLYVYKKTDVVTASDDQTTVTLLKQVTLPLTGGSTALCSMAANNGFLFIGTNLTSNGVRVQKSNLAMVTFGGFSPPMNVTSITADRYGYVAATFSGGGFTGNIEFGPNGNSVGDGGGAWFMLDTFLGVSPSNIPAFPDQFPLPLGYRPKSVKP